MGWLYAACQRCDAAIVLVVEGQVPDRILCERCRLAEDNLTIEIDTLEAQSLRRTIAAYIVARVRTWGGPLA